MLGYLNLAMVQVASPSTSSDWEIRKQENFKKMEEYVKIICNTNPAVNLIVFPEFYMNGIGYEPSNFAESIPGPMTEQFSQLAQKYKIWLAPGSFAEKAENDGECYNTAILISPEGDIKLSYRKVFVPYPLEQSKRGSEFPVYDIPNIGKIGFMICADFHFPEAARNLALNGAEVIIKPTLQHNWIGGLKSHTPVMITRAIENQCYFVSVNHPSPIGMGDSIAVDPEGRIIEQLGESESFTIVTLNLNEVRRIRETGFMGVFGFLKMLKESKDSGLSVDECYTRGISNAPVYDTLKYPPAKVPSDIKEIWDRL